MTASIAPTEALPGRPFKSSARAADVDSLWGMPVLVMLAALLSTVVITNAPFFYVRFLNEYGATHEAASWPLTIVAVVSHLAGAGLGVVMICLSIYTMDYFDKFRGTASGLKYFGWSASGLVFPVILATVVDAYNFRGMLLLLGGLMANITPMMILLKHPRVTMRWDCLLSMMKHFSPKGSVHKGIVNDKRGACPGKYCSIPPAEAASVRSTEGCAARGVSHLTSPVEGSGTNSTLDQRLPRQNGTGTNVFDPVPVPQDTSKRSFRKHAFSTLSEKEGEDVDERRLNSVVLHGNGEHLPRSLVDAKSENGGDRNNASSRSWRRKLFGNTSSEGSVLDTRQPSGIAADVSPEIWTMLRTPSLYALAGIYVLYDFSYIAIMSNIVAYAVDKGSPLPLAESLIMYTAVSGMAGRLVVPFASDSLALRRDVFVAWNIMVVALCVALLPEVSAHAHMAVLVVGVSIASGSVLSMKPVLVTEYVGVEMMTATWGLMGVLMVPLMVSNPRIVGYFRDGMGSFDNFYRLHSALNILIALILFALACHRKNRENRDTKLNK
ncbi:hypothetical protein V5799_025899 [Amblyomma americanum]|uniref:Monocarboxylate transporter n=1 Tax=Amblyomma americanum TaxID=6943 RepID=A0AAQ4E7Y6_AMBAM